MLELTYRDKRDHISPTLLEHVVHVLHSTPRVLRLRLTAEVHIVLDEPLGLQVVNLQLAEMRVVRYTVLDRQKPTVML